MAVILETTVGDLVVDLYPEERPRCCLNFLKLCKIKYFNFCLLHSIQRNFMAQTGDPTGTGKGGASIFSKLYGDQAKYFEMENNPRIKHKKKGAVSMVNNGENMHGSQFFFTLAEDLDYLDGQHTVFGEVTEGFDVLEKINEAFCDKENRPYQDIRISHTIVLDDPFDDPEGLDIPDRSPEPTKEQLASVRIGADEEIEDDKGKSKEEVEEEEKKKDATANAQILEMIGDLPDADVKPPENVLFVCKLNPLTTSEDLEIIFSRFGKISSCEVIKDKVTGDSLSYAFIEFEREEDCEEAYFKMDNVLIDDRRIHVDFSQSVAKLKTGPSGPVIPQKGGESSKYAIKDTKSKQSQKYGLVLDEDDNYGGHQRSYQKKQRRYSSESDSENERHRNKSKKEKRDTKRDSSSEESYRDDRRHQKKKRQKDRRGGSSSSEDDRKRRRKEKRARDDSESEDEMRKERAKASHRKAASGSSDDERYSRRRTGHDRSREDRPREDDRGRDEERRRRKDERREKDRYSGRGGDRDNRYREQNRDKYRERNRDR
ncbi:peptidyl-prolyl cis-trans isomerase-like 4 isoform X2 [Lytechinus variegatus]|uniref:peptidyl-prolyl cis-trans isomerase-like 4 isoform X2 n=1 Tax=Lytechinus variegatus TaxID=7654 RepID=UPI001BB1E6C2|nr:peptidyl-prolyl cis-trans isomerase-like 4 isoform X2 [Lytechinus variegatus]